MGTSYELQLPFLLRGLDGAVEVSVTENTHPSSIGYPLIRAGDAVEYARGFPVCRADVSYPAEGYAAVFGWIQVVQSTDGPSPNFEVDPIEIYQEVSTPFAWYGLKPRLFDAPSRETRGSVHWRARSFLCVSPDAVVTRQAQAIAGFGWGFNISNGEIEICQPSILEATDWNEHRALLIASYPSWKFGDGFLQ
jgi:hypothetical protein